MTPSTLPDAPGPVATSAADDPIAARLRGFGGLGTIYAFTRRLALLMIAQVAFDLTAVALIYYGLEERVARSIFG